MYVQTRVYRIVGTGLDVHTRVYRFAGTDLYVETRVYTLVGTDLYVQTRVYRIVGTDLHVQAHVHRHARAHGGSVFRARPHFNGYNSKRLIQTIGPRGPSLSSVCMGGLTRIASKNACA